ncbi:MAG: S1 RNA-binding domain-containing protein [Deltaproteobacteria bacterium]|nr:S1 RNA-binding domain-containing protein [Deltaproteobacteria bacterium]
MGDFKQDNASFDEMLEASFAAQGRIEAGDRLSAKVVSIGANDVFLDVGMRSEGLLPKVEVTVDGEIQVAPGDSITVYVTAVRGGVVHCTRRLGGTRAADPKEGNDATREALADAFRNGIPVEGTVQSVNKGGFEVLVLGQRAFCPVSQIERRYCEKPEAHVGAKYVFRIIKLEENGRNIVVSRKKLLEAEAEEQARAFWERVAVGETYEGTVTSIHGYGAFVDLGGAEGLLHVSEISFERVGDPKEVLSVGQKLTVAVKDLDPAKRKISLSLKALTDDPWFEAARTLVAGREYQGRVTRLMPFGAFVELLPGVEGLLHVSRLGGDKHIHHPREVVSEGAAVTVIISEIDEARRRISLSMSGVGENEAGAEELASYAKERPRAGFGTLGDLLGGKGKKK